MGLHLVGLGTSSDVRVSPVGTFAGTCDVPGDVPSGLAEGEERLACAHIHCQRGAPERTGNDCLVCTRFRGWREGPGPSHVTVRCAWSHDSPVWARMTRAEVLVTVPAELPLAEAAEVARRSGVRHLLATEEGRLAGILCLCDLYPEPRPGERVDERMRPDVFAVRSDASLEEAVAAMAALEVGCLPVVEGHTLVGLITRGDLRRAGIPEALLGARTCRACGSVHGVRPDPRNGVDFCLDCLDEETERLDPDEYGVGD